MSAAEDAVVIALGNRFRGDDGVALWVADRLSGLGGRSVVVEGSVDPMTIINAWQGAGLAVVVDAAASGALPGTIRRFEGDARLLPKDVARCSSHGLGLTEAWELGRALGRIPDRLVVYTVEAGTFEPGNVLSADVAQAVESVVERVTAEINSFNQR